MQNGTEVGAGLGTGQRNTVPWSALFSFTRRRHLPALSSALCLSIASGVLEPAMTIFVGKFFNAFVDFSAAKISNDELMNRVLLPIYAFLVLGGLMILLRGGACFAWTVFGEMQARAVREDLFRGLLEKDLEWFEMRERGVGNLLSRLQTQISELQIATSLPIGNAITYIVEALAAMGIAFYYSWRLTLVIFAGVPVLAVVVHLLSRRIQPNISRQNEALLIASRISNTAISQISLVKCCNTQGRELLHYVGPVMDAAKFYIRQIRIISLQIGLIKFITTIIFIQGLWYGNVMVHHGSLNAGKVVTTFWATLMGVQAFQTLVPPLITLEKGRVAAAALRSILSTVDQGRKAAQHAKGLYPDYCDGDVHMSGVSFDYPARPGHNVLQNCYFRFPARRTTFLIGRSGSGKSTVGNLLLRFYPISDGTISVDGHDVALLDPAFLRNNVTLVQQQSVLFNETILKNIAFGHQYHDHVAYELIEECLDVVGLQPTVTGLPEGIMTRVGAGGASLSGGQKQRIALARARLRNTPILVLDEATSALDYVSRLAVMEHLRRWRVGRTTIIITHDMAFIDEDDYVYVLEDGRVVAQDHKRALPRTSQRTDEDIPLVKPSPEVISRLDEPHTAKNRKQQTSQLPVHTSSVPTTQHDRTRRDSLEYQLRAVAQERNSMASRYIRRTRLFSGFVSNRPSLIAALNDFIQPPVPSLSKHLRSEKAAHLPQVKSDSRNTLSKPRSSTLPAAGDAGRGADKRLPTPHVFQTTKLYRRVSAGRDTVDTNADGQRHFPIRKIVSTVWPSLDGKTRLKAVMGLVAVLAQAVLPACFAFVLVYIFQTLYSELWKPKALKYSLILLLVASGDGAASFFARYLLEIVAQSWTTKIRVEAMRRILEQPRTWFDQDSNSPAYLTSALDRNAEVMRGLVGRFIPTIFHCLCLTAVTIVWSMVVCWKLTLVAMGAVSLIYVLAKAFDIVSARWESRTNTAADLIGDTFDETFTNIKTVRALTLESYFHRKYRLAVNDAFAIGIRRGAYIGLFGGISECSLNLLLALIFYYGAYLAKTGSFTNPAILHSISLLIFGSSAVHSIISYIPQLASSVDTASRLLHLAQLPLRSHEYTGHLRLNRHDPQTLNGPIHFINNTFSYPTRPFAPVLKQLNLYIPPHECTAIVGPSGSGKTTIASLLLGLYPSGADPATRTASDATGGPPSITLTGRDIRTLHVPTLRGIIAWVPQTPVIFPMSVRENLTYGLDPASNRAGEGSIRLAARQAGVHDFIMSLPDQYDTVIGDGGLGVSGGQAQRIVIARALVRRPKILILDEPTSALDAESAGIIKQSIASILAQNRDKSKVSSRGGLTVIVITHAREMMEFADNVVVMEAGSVVEEGRFEGLMGKKGKLWDMLKAGGVDD